MQSAKLYVKPQMNEYYPCFYGRSLQNCPQGRGQGAGSRSREQGAMSKGGSWMF